MPDPLRPVTRSDDAGTQRQFLVTLTGAKWGIEPEDFGIAITRCGYFFGAIAASELDKGAAIVADPAGLWAIVRALTAIAISSSSISDIETCEQMREQVRAALGIDSTP